MKAAFVLLLALSIPYSLAYAHDAAPPSPPVATPPEASQPVAPAPFDARAYWARFDAEQAARQAQEKRVDVRTPKILTLSLLVPAAALLLTAAIKSLFEWSPAGPFELLPSHSGSPPERGHVSPVNYWLAGAGGAFALGALGTGMWWQQRRLEQTRLERALGSARGPALALRVGAQSVGLVLSGRL